MPLLGLLPRELALQDGLKGNRVVAGDLWALLRAIERAYPLLLGPTMQAVASLQPNALQQPQQALQLWLLQVRWQQPACIVPATGAHLQSPQLRAGRCSRHSATQAAQAACRQCTRRAGSARRQPCTCSRQAAGPAAAAERLHQAGTGQERLPGWALPGLRAAAAGLPQLARHAHQQASRQRAWTAACLHARLACAAQLGRVWPSHARSMQGTPFADLGSRPAASKSPDADEPGSDGVPSRAQGSPDVLVHLHIQPGGSVGLRLTSSAGSAAAPPAQAVPAASSAESTTQQPADLGAPAARQACNSPATALAAGPAPKCAQAAAAPGSTPWDGAAAPGQPPAQGAGLHAAEALDQPDADTLPAPPSVPRALPEAAQAAALPQQQQRQQQLPVPQHSAISSAPQSPSSPAMSGVAAAAPQEAGADARLPSRPEALASAVFGALRSFKGRLGPAAGAAPGECGRAGAEQGLNRLFEWRSAALHRLAAPALKGCNRSAVRVVGVACLALE